MTDGVLLAEKNIDPLLLQYDTIIVDEAHERSLNIDFLLGILKQILVRRLDLKVIISSATIDTEKFSRHFSKAPVINIIGRSFPISIEYRPLNEENTEEQVSYVEHAVNECITLFNDTKEGDILIFMPSERDIKDCIDGIQKKITYHPLILPLFGRLQAKDQRRIFHSTHSRKIIVASNIAETSITVPGIRYVIDTGLARISKYNVRSKTTSLQIGKISKASCSQRTGRCGRTGPGLCIRLFSEDDFQARPDYTLPEIQRSNLAEVILQMINLRLGDPRRFPYIDQPAPRSITDGYKTLYELGALDRNTDLTKKGKLMARLPLDPCISKIIIEGAELGVLKEVKIIAAALSIMDPRVRPADSEKKADAAHQIFLAEHSDFISYLNIWERYQDFIGTDTSASKLRRFCKKYYLSWQRMREWFDVLEQINRLLQNKKQFLENEQPGADSSIHMALASGFLRNICQKKEKNFYTSSGGREVMIFPGSSLFNKGGQWIISSSFIETSRLYARTVANIDVRWLENLGGELCKKSWSNPYWDTRSGRVTALEKVSLFGLIIVSGRRINYGRINQDSAREAREIFIRSALIEGKLGGSYSFLKHNLSLADKFKQIEERIRKRIVLEDEQTIFNFYDTNLGDVYDRHTLDLFLNTIKNDSRLFMSEEDICKDHPDKEELYKFPSVIRTNNYKLNVTYRFQPGHKKDGVSVDIPLAILKNINPSIFEWIVPGLLQEKILWLLKALPKRIRKHLVPLPDTVDRILDSLDLYKGSLYPSLEKIILKNYQVSVLRTEWEVSSLPLHLLMNYRLCDENGQVIISSRNFQDLSAVNPVDAKLPPQGAENFKLPFKDRIVSWDFEGMDFILPVFDKDGNTAYLYYATLFVDLKNNWLKLKYIEDINESKKLNNQGMVFLYKQHFIRETKDLAKECKELLSLQSASLLSLGIACNFKQLTEMFNNFLLKDIFEIRDGSIHPRVHFEAVVKRVKQNGFLRIARPHLHSLIELVKQRREVLSTLNITQERTQKTRSCHKENFENFKNLLDAILPPAFLETMHLDELKHTERYMQALKLRIIRAEHDPLKDVRKAEKLFTPVNRLEEVKSFLKNSTDACQICLQEYRHMLEEFKVSIFAPELGTAMKVSEKRLKQKWQEVIDRCKTVE
jgi:ATP-dependent helicase HrpA